ncbi:hypothetical protein AB4Z21_27775, partial [Paenibacillus sp. MCAF20]
MFGTKVVPAGIGSVSVVVAPIFPPFVIVDEYTMVSPTVAFVLLTVLLTVRDGWNTGVAIISENAVAERAPEVKLTNDWLLTTAGFGIEVTVTLKVTGTE